MSPPDPTERYRHTQIGYTMLVSLACGVVILLVVCPRVEPLRPAAHLLVAALLLIVLVLFSTLTVVVRAREVDIRFGPGIIRKRYALSDFLSVSVVRSRWYWGLGIRLIPKGWLYCVSGLDAVELVRKNGRVVRIGTDEPEALATALREALTALRRTGGGAGPENDR